MGMFALWYVPYFKRARARKAQRRAEIRAAAATQPEPGSSDSKTVSSTETPGTSTRS
jgi:ribosomal protein L32